VTPIGRSCAIGAVVLAVITIATWDRGKGEAIADAPTTTAVADGSQLFRAKGCATCHDGPDSTAAFDEFPSLADAPGWASDRRPGMSAAEYIAKSIREPGAFISPAWVGGGPTTAMPQLGLTAAEIAAVVDYLLGTGDERPDDDVSQRV
jgi:mono/diheme cytochrome c family protein